MRGPINIFRLLQTGATFERTGAMPLILEAFQAPPLLRSVVRGAVLPFRWMGHAGDPTMPPATRALTALGPAYIKFGQILSTRPDVVGEELARQLRILQDRLPPFPAAVARAEVERELAQPVDALFSEFSEPVAGRVHRPGPSRTPARHRRGGGRQGPSSGHRARLPPRHRRLPLRRALLDLFVPSARRLRPLDVIDHFEGVVRGELDLRLEASAASEFADNTAGDDGFRVPAIRWPYSARRVMTLDWVEGIGAAEVEAIRAQGHDTSALARRVLQLFLRHALRDGYFHGDMHQGNLKVDAAGNIVAFDFGIMGRIDDYTRRVYAEILIGFIRRDYRRVAEVHFEAGYVPARPRRGRVRPGPARCGEPIFGMDASRISMGRLLAYLFEVTERFGMQTRTELILLQRTMVVVEGVARTLDPRMNIWDAAGPVVEGYIRDSWVRWPSRATSPGPPGCWRASPLACRSSRARASSARPRPLPPWWRVGSLVAGLYMAAGALLAILGVLLIETL
jgi:ubiquinone biosynthesis protein